jgi:hypothetical protein
MCHRFGLQYIDMVIYHIDMVILDIDVGDKANDMGDDNIDTVIYHIEMGYLVTLRKLKPKRKLYEKMPSAQNSDPQCSKPLVTRAHYRLTSAVACTHIRRGGRSRDVRRREMRRKKRRRRRRRRRRSRRPEARNHSSHARTITLRWAWRASTIQRLRGPPPCASAHQSNPNPKP